MPAALLSTDVLRVLNVGSSGALVEGERPLAENAEYRMQLVLEGYVAEALVKVRRVEGVPDARGRSRYRMGVEFLSVSPETQVAIDEIVAAHQTQA
jgi:hypothetical protein